MKKGTKKKFFGIEQILILISFICFTNSIFFKNQAEKKFSDLNQSLNSLQLDYLNIIYSDEKQQFISKLEKDFLPFTTYDESLESKIKNITSMVMSESFELSDIHYLMENLVTAQTIINGTQQKIAFGYDTILYTSIIILGIALFLITSNNQKKQKEIERISIMNDTQIKFSRDLHDGVAQDLAALKVYLQKNEIEKSKYYADQAFQEVRYLIGAMHLDLTKSFEEILQQTLLVFEANYGIKTQFFNASVYAKKITNDSQIEFFRILQEALSNIARHSQATEVTVKITDLGNDFRFIISDNGIGFSQEDVNQKNESDVRTHYGLENIKERVAALGGTVDFINEGGTTIAICIKNIIH